MIRSTARSLAGLSIIAIVIGAVMLLHWLLRPGGEEALVVYCAHDSIYSEAILKTFEEQTGVPVRIRFDTEATKSLGLIELLIKEKDAPRCDVFWNNEWLGTADLKERGILAPYKGSGYARIPDTYKDSEGYFTGFGARMRVYICGENVEAAQEGVSALLSAEDLSRVAIAKPLYGTTLTHYTVLWHLWGAEKLKDWHREVREKGMKEVGGNAVTKDLVAEGACDLGYTDTDDFFVAKFAGKSVEMVPCETENGKVICIPNTVGIIQGTQRMEQAKQLVDFLLSEKTEVALANAKSRQIPLGAVDVQQLPEEVKLLKQAATNGVDLSSLGKARNECLSWLKSIDGK